MTRIHAANIDTLNSKDLQNCSIIHVVDHENLTRERFQKLISLAERAERGYAIQPALDKVNEKLREYTSTPDFKRFKTPDPDHEDPTSSNGSQVSTPGEEKGISEMKESAENHLQYLVCWGGSPTAPINYHPGQWVPNSCDESLHAVNHWTNESRRLRIESHRWQFFRCFQLWNRKDDRRFKRYTTEVKLYMADHKIQWNTEFLKHKLVEQTRLELWREYFVYEQRALSADYEYQRQGRERAPGSWVTARLGQDHVQMMDPIKSRITEREQLSEWIKIQVAEIEAGRYQDDVNANALKAGTSNRNRKPAKRSGVEICPKTVSESADAAQAYDTILLKDIDPDIYASFQKYFDNLRREIRARKKKARIAAQRPANRELKHQDDYSSDSDIDNTINAQNETVQNPISKQGSITRSNKKRRRCETEDNSSERSSKLQHLKVNNEPRQLRRSARIRERSQHS